MEKNFETTMDSIAYRFERHLGGWLSCKNVNINGKEIQHELDFLILMLLTFKNRFMFYKYFNHRSVEKGVWYKAMVCEPPRIHWFLNIKLNTRLFYYIGSDLITFHLISINI